MNYLEQVIYNEGERLIPFVTHNDEEVIRHFSSYNFFCEIIKNDITDARLRNVRLLDIGFGVGYGCFMYSNIEHVKDIVGIDPSLACKQYAEQFYRADNITLFATQAEQFLNSEHTFDYITSRGVLEHIPNGLQLVAKANYSKRLIIDVPYKERPGNEHHVLLNIDESYFNSFKNCELFYEGLDGVIYDASTRPENPNMILCVLSASELQPIANIFQFPVSAVTVKQVKNDFLKKREISHNESTE